MLCIVSLTEAYADTAAGAVAEGQQVRPPAAQQLLWREVFEPSLWAEYIRVLPHRVHALNCDDGNEDDLRRGALNVSLSAQFSNTACLSRRDDQMSELAAVRGLYGIPKRDDVSSLCYSFHVGQRRKHPQPIEHSNETVCVFGGGKNTHVSLKTASRYGSLLLKSS